MFWPRFRLTPGEERLGMTKYYDYDHGRRGVLRKIYPGQLSLTQTQRLPVFNFQIARRCRVFALTASGDLAAFKIDIFDSSGEHYTAQPIPLPALFGGYCELPPPAFSTGVEGATGGFPPTIDDAANTLGWAAPQGNPSSYAPLVFEPNIVLDSNQVLQVAGTPMTDYDSVNYRVDLCFHVWEFPSWKNGPA